MAVYLIEATQNVPAEKISKEDLIRFIIKFWDLLYEEDSAMITKDDVSNFEKFEDNLLGYSKSDDYSDASKEDLEVMYDYIRGLVSEKFENIQILKMTLTDCELVNLVFGEPYIELLAYDDDDNASRIGNLYDRYSYHKDPENYRRQFRKICRNYGYYSPESEDDFDTADWDGIYFEIAYLDLQDDIFGKVCNS